MRPRVEASLIGWAAIFAALAPGRVLAQNDSVPLPPRIERPANPVLPGSGVLPAPTGTETGPPPILGSLRPPNAATLAPLPEDRANKPDEIIVIGRGWRLPDLGSEWRKRQEETEDSGRSHVTFLPLYDPNRPPERTESLLAPSEWQRHGYIELFRMRFGKRAGDEETPSSGSKPQRSP